MSVALAIPQADQWVVSPGVLTQVGVNPAGGPSWTITSRPESQNVPKREIDDGS
jgi:hypothetical protein